MDPESKNNWRHFDRLKVDRKKLNKRAKKAEKATLKHAHTFIVRRWGSIYDVRRHMLGWLFLIGLLIVLTGVQMVWFQNSYMEEASVPGGTYAEGVVGPLGTLNPLFATSNPERSATQMIFSGLFSYDRHNRVRGDLAKSWRLEDSGKKYVITLKDDIHWQDGKKLTSEDVVFTVNLMKNPKVNSPLYNSWKDIDALAVGEKTVVFTLPAVYSPFLNALNFGVVPKHLLKDVAPQDVRESSFSLHPIGSGPFAFRSLQNLNAQQGRSVLYLEAFDDYFKGKPKIENLQLHVYGKNSELENALETSEINTVNELSAAAAKRLEDRFTIADVSINHGVYAIFRTDSTILKDQKIRSAIRYGTNTEKIREAIGGNVAALQGPLLENQVEGISSLKQPDFDSDQANKILDQAGWKKGSDGIRKKGSQQLVINLVSLKDSDYETVAKELSKQWKKLGIKVDMRLVAPEDIQQNILRPRAYDVLLYELAIGADPDVYAYWHSSQATQSGLNFANYKSGIADDALLSARARFEESLRKIKYTSFVRQWLKDTPAVALYQSTIRYGSNREVRSLAPDASIVSPIDRYRLVEYWTVQLEPRYKTP